MRGQATSPGLGGPLAVSDSLCAQEDMRTLRPCVAENKSESDLLEVGSVQPTSGLEGFRLESA